MKYLKISNKGVLDPRLIFLMGGTTKSNDTTKIGTFGTGLKYAISFLIRNNVDFRLFVGEDEVIFNTESQTIGDNSFEEIYCNGKSMNITTHYGHQWVAWEALREIWCNSLDEGYENRSVVDSRSKIVGKDNTTTIYIQMTKEIKDVVDNWGTYFLNATPLFEDETVGIFNNCNNPLKLYKNTVLIDSSGVYKSLFNYDIKGAELNELRQYRGYHRLDIGKALLNSNKAVIAILLKAIQDGIDCYETKLDWEYITHDKKKVKQLFGGYLFLHPDSDTPLKGRCIKVNLSLFNILQGAGLNCEKVTKAYGGYFGRSGTGYDSTKVGSYKKIDMPELSNRIQAILERYNASLEFIIGVPIKSDFEVIVAYPKAVFSSELERLSDDDLESTVLIALLHAKNKNIYLTLKRLVKILYKKNYFKSIFFGTKEEKKQTIEEFPEFDELLNF